MKKTKLFTSIFTCILLIAAFMLPIFNINIKYVSAAPTPSNYIDFQIKSIPNSFVIGQDTEIILPKPNKDEVSYEVYDPFGDLVTLLNSGDNQKFTPNKVGKYKVNFVYTQGVFERVFSIKSINVTSEKVKFTFPKNTANIIPDEINIDMNKVIKLPLPTVDNEVANAVFTVTVLEPNNNVVDIYNGPFTDDSEDFEEYTQPGLAGEYRFIYTYKVDDAVLAKQTFTMNANTVFDDEYDLTCKLSPSTTSITTSLGVPKTLPTPTGINDETKAEVEIYYEIEIKKGNVDVTNDVFDFETFEFKSFETGDYTLKYYISDFFGNEAESFKIPINVTADTVDPIVYYGYYDEVSEEIVDMLYSLPNVSGINNIVLPAIYATDNSNGIVTYKREIRRSATTTTLDEGTIGSTDSKKPIIINYDEDTFADVANIDDYIIYETKTFTTGTYSVRYTATDNSNNTTTKSYNMEIKESPESKETIITFETILPTSVDVGKTIKFLKPTAENETDTRLLIETFYKIDDGAEIKLVDDNNDGYYEIITDTSGELTITVYVTDDFATTTLDKKVNVNAIPEDNTAPSLDLIQDRDEFELNQDFVQNSNIYLRSFKIHEEYPNHLDVSIQVIDPSGRPVSVSGKHVVYDTDSVEVDEAYFIASKIGVYTVTYIATDVGGNILVVSYQTPEVTIDPGATVAYTSLNSVIELEYGNTLVLPAPNILNNSSQIEFDSYIVKVTSENGEYSLINNNIFVPKDPNGRYTLSYEVTVGEEIITTIGYIIIVKDTTGPVITVDYDDHETDLVLEKDDTLNIKPFAAFDNDENIQPVIDNVDYHNCKIEVKKGSTTMLTLKPLENDAEDYEYKFTSNATYTIIYTAVDYSGNTSTKTFTVKVGDTIQPTITISPNVSFKDRTVGDEFVIDINAITIADDKDEDINNATNTEKQELLIVKLVNKTTNETVSNEVSTGYKYVLDTVGEYEITFNLTDTAGNKTTVTKSFLVSATPADPSFPTKVVGIVLISVASALLIGVVAYFIITRKKSSVKKVDKK